MFCPVLGTGLYTVPVVLFNLINTISPSVHILQMRKLRHIKAE